MWWPPVCSWKGAKHGGGGESAQEILGIGQQQSYKAGGRTLAWRAIKNDECPFPVQLHGEISYLYYAPLRLRVIYIFVRLYYYCRIMEWRVRGQK